MKKKQPTFVEAGPTSIELVFSPGFKQLCKHLDISPEQAIKQLVTELGVCCVHSLVNSASQKTTSLLFKAMTGVRGGQPDEPSPMKRKISDLYLFMLLHKQESIADPAELAAVRKQIVANWYRDYKKRCVCPKR